MTHDPHSAVEQNAASAKAFLIELIRFQSTPANEGEAIICARDWFARAGCDCLLVPLPDDLAQDPEYSHSDQYISYKDRANLVALRKGHNRGHSVILQSHMDVVPAGDWADAFVPREDGQYIIGRGALDAKGQVVTIWLAMKALYDMGYEPAGDVQVQVVVEEELGGNGALALLRQGWRADASIILEGTQLQIHPSNRGAIWFRIDIEGLPCHMGRKHEGISAIDLAYKVITALYDYESRIVADSAGYPGFERYERPVQVNIGMLNSGTWPAMVAANARIEGGVGFLPNRSMEQVKRELREVIESIPDDWLRSHHTLDFPKLHNDSYETNFGHPAVKTLCSACKASGLDSEVFGWNVSCDARLYAKIGGMPTIVFGPGSISDAHARDEKIDFGEIVKAAEVLARFVVEWCG